jgi:hypothetical protein
MTNGSQAGDVLKKIDPSIVERAGDRALDWVGRMVGAGRYEALAAWLERAGHYGLLTAAGLGILYGIVAGIKSDTLSSVLSGIAWGAVVLIVQYTAAKFSSAGAVLIRSSPSEMASRSFLLCVALLCLFGGVLALVGLTVEAIRQELWAPFALGVVIFMVCEFVVCFCLNPGMLNLSIASSFGAGREAIGVLTFFMKAPVKLVPVLFGSGVLIGCCALAWQMIELFRGSEIYDIFGLPSAYLILGSAAVPLATYLLFLLLYLQMDVIRAVLAVPGKLDSLRDRQGQG